MSNAQAQIRMKRKLRLMLLAAGLEGLSQTRIKEKCRTYHGKANPNGVTVQQINATLDEWRARHLVQLFEDRVGFAKRPTRIWRATTLLRNNVF
jgi:hypothetical protein